MQTNDIKWILAQNIRTYRKINNYSQFELAVQADVSEQTINSIEGCRLWPSDKTLNKLSEALNVEIYKLFIPQEIKLSKELENELKNSIVKSIEKYVAELLKDI